MKSNKNCGEIKEIIDELEDKQPPLDSPQYEEWKNYFNKFANLYNNLCNFKAYKEIV